jgi:diguanylate cyclase (GGDEF)-like protein
LRSEDLLCRYGGEEFAVLIQRTRLEDVFQIADRICKMVSQKLITTNNIEIRVTISMGISTIDKVTSNLDGLLRRADMALYAAKEAGRNLWKLWEPSLVEN